MKIIEQWKEPPVLDTPDPKFGGVIKSLNDLLFTSEEQNEVLGTTAVNQIAALRAKIAAYKTNTPKLFDPHLNGKGALHGETKNTIGLPLVDNFRKATIAEQVNRALVDALCTPAGVKAAITDNLSIRLEDYQKNDLFTFGSIHTTDFYSHVTNGWKEVPYFLDGHCPIAIQNDRLVFSPKQDPAVFKGYNGYQSDALKAGSSMSLNEQPDMEARYLGECWGMRGAQTTDNKVALFRPLVNLKKFNYPSQVVTATGTKAYLLWDMYLSNLVQGMAVNVSLNGNALSINHDMFKANNPDTDPTLVSAVSPSLTANLTTIRQTGSVLVKGTHLYSLTDFVTLPAGGSITPNLNAKIKFSVSLIWAVQDREAYLHIAIPVILKVGTKSVERILRFTESWMVNGLNTGAPITITQVGTLTKDVVDANLNITGEAKWLMPCDWTDALNPVGLPGVILSTGQVCQARSTKYGLKVKYSNTPLKSTLDWVNGYKSATKPLESVTRTFSPGRYTTFGEIPERIIPVDIVNGNIRYLCYQDINKRQGYGWMTRTWYEEDVLQTAILNTYSAKVPDTATITDFPSQFNPSLVIKASKLGGLALTGMAFTFANNYVGKDDFSYSGTTLTSGTDVVLSPATRTMLTLLGNDILTRAGAQYGASYAARHSEIVPQVFCIDSSKALVVISDGLAYAEAGIFPYTITGGVATVTLATTSNLSVVTNPTAKPSLLNRTSATDDGVNHIYSDILLYQIDANNFRVSIPRAFGNVYGDINFTITGYTSTPVFGYGTTNIARLYGNDSPIDIVEELHPPILVQKFGVFGYVDSINTPTKTTLREVGGSGTVDPYLPPDAYFCKVPSGTRCILGGRSFSLESSLYIAHDGTEGTCFYLTRLGNTISLEKSAAMKEPSNNSVLYAKWTGGGLQIQQSYIVLDNHMLSYQRRGSAIPLTVDDGGARGSNVFFRYKDVLQEDTGTPADYSWVPELLAGTVQFIQYNTAGQQRSPTDDFDIGFVDIKFNARSTLINPYLKVTDIEQAANGGNYFTYSLTQNGVYADSVIIQKAQIAVGESVRVYVKVADPRTATRRVRTYMSMSVGGNWVLPKVWDSGVFGYQLTNPLDSLTMGVTSYSGPDSGPTWGLNFASAYAISGATVTVTRGGYSNGYAMVGGSVNQLTVGENFAAGNNGMTVTANRVLNQDYADSIPLNVVVSWNGMTKTFNTTSYPYNYEEIVVNMSYTDDYRQVESISGGGGTVTNLWRLLTVFVKLNNVRALTNVTIVPRRTGSIPSNTETDVSINQKAPGSLGFGDAYSIGNVSANYNFRADYTYRIPNIAPNMGDYYYTTKYNFIFDVYENGKLAGTLTTKQYEIEYFAKGRDTADGNG